MEGNSNRAEAERYLGIAEKLLIARDLIGSKKFAVRAQDADPLLDGVDQILAVADVLLAAEKRINNHLDWYAILQIDRRSNDLKLIKRRYNRLVMLLDPNKNRSDFSDNAFKLVVDAWAVLSNPSKKSLYDNELTLFSKFDPVALNDEQPQQNPARWSARSKKRKAPAEENCNSGNERPSLMSTFWTACPFCYNLYEYPRVYEDCCLRCVKCKRAFQAVAILSPPPAIPGKDAYYCCWGFFPLAFSMPDSGSGKNAGFPNWMPFSPMFPFGSQPEGKRNTDDQDSSVDIVEEGIFSTAKAQGKKGDENFSGQERKDGEPLQAGSGVRVDQQVPNFGMPQKRKKKTVARKSTKLMGNGSQSKKIEKEPVPTMNVEGRAAGSGDEDVAEGIGFFKGLDDILSSLPILSVAEEQKVDGA